MSMGGRAQARQRMLRNAGLIAAALVLVALLLLVSGHWILGVIFGAAAAFAVVLFMQLRRVR
jgi:hypothetical protein